MGPKHIRDGFLTITQVKNGEKKPVTVTLPVLKPLQDIIVATECGEETFIVTAFGNPFTANGFGNRFRKWCDEAGLPQCSAHGMRKAAASRMGDFGANSLQIAAVLGHTTTKHTDTYTRGASKRILAEAGLSYLERGLAAQTVPPISEDRESGTDPDANPLKQGGEKAWMVPRGGIEPPTLRFSVLITPSAAKPNSFRKALC